MGLLTQIVSRLAPHVRTVYHGPYAESLEILVLQPTPFCNINCDYCYLPDRDNTSHMGTDTIRSAVRLVLEGNLVGGCLSIVWHAGEPLVLPVEYYKEAFATISETVQGRCAVLHCFQTNGTLIDDSWCELFRAHPTRIGVSIDGPAFLHDRHRRTRLGKGTHAQTMSGVQRLQQHGIPFHVIAVLSSDSLNHAASLFTFFEGLGVRELGFNVEELEGSHECSSLATTSAEKQVEQFWGELYDLWNDSDGRVQIREFQRAARAILTSEPHRPWHEIAQHNDQVLPFRIISVNYQGVVSTFSPELLGSRSVSYDFDFGQVKDQTLVSIQKSSSFQKMASEIWNGVKACSETCEFFSACGGGAPSNKYFENGTFSSTATMYCRSSIQAPLIVVLRAMERTLGVADAH